MRLALQAALACLSLVLSFSGCASFNRNPNPYRHEGPKNLKITWDTESGLLLSHELFVQVFHEKKRCDLYGPLGVVDSKSGDEISLPTDRMIMLRMIAGKNEGTMLTGYHSSSARIWFFLFAPKPGESYRLSYVHKDGLTGIEMYRRKNGGEEKISGLPTECLKTLQFLPPKN